MTAVVLYCTLSHPRSPTRKTAVTCEINKMETTTLTFDRNSSGLINSPGSVSTHGNNNTVIVGTIDNRGEKVYNILDTSRKMKIPIPSEGVGSFALIVSALGILADILAVKGEYSNHRSEYVDFF